LTCSLHGSCCCGTCGCAALPCGKAPPFRPSLSHPWFLGEAEPRRLRRSLNPRIGTTFEARPGKAEPFRKTGRQSRSPEVYAAPVRGQMRLYQDPRKEQGLTPTSNRRRQEGCGRGGARRLPWLPSSGTDADSKAGSARSHLPNKTTNPRAWDRCILIRWGKKPVTLSQTCGVR
jgi:hypothetical protein